MLRLKRQEAAGADYVGAEDLRKDQKENWFDFDSVVATGHDGRCRTSDGVLGLKGLMQTLSPGTVTMDVQKRRGEIKAGKVEYRLDKANIMSCNYR